jgi:hypothetical protein
MSGLVFAPPRVVTVIYIKKNVEKLTTYLTSFGIKLYRILEMAGE